jgi:hypothetical protein
VEAAWAAALPLLDKACYGFASAPCLESSRSLGIRNYQVDGVLILQNKTAPEGGSRAKTRQFDPNSPIFR